MLRFAANSCYRRWGGNVRHSHDASPHIQLPSHPAILLVVRGFRSSIPLDELAGVARLQLRLRSARGCSNPSATDASSRCRRRKLCSLQGLRILASGVFLCAQLDHAWRPSCIGEASKGRKETWAESGCLWREVGSSPMLECQQTLTTVQYRGSSLGRRLRRPL